MYCTVHKGPSIFQTEIDRYFQKKVFTFCKIFEIVQFFEHVYINFAKWANMGQKFIFVYKFHNGVSKNAEFYADSKFIVHKNAQKKSEKSEKL